MITKIFSVYDSKAEVFGKPFFSGTKGLALRSFTEISNDSASEIGKYPADFTLFELGEYDDSNGSFGNIRNVSLKDIMKKLNEQRIIRPGYCVMLPSL